MQTHFQPYFHSFADFLAMGEHGVYVWSSWGLTVAVVVGLILYSRQQRKNLLETLRLQQIRKEKRNIVNSKPNSKLNNNPNK